MAALSRPCECLEDMTLSLTQLNGHSCHGPAVFDDLIDPATGKPLIQGKTITGFTTEAEVDMKILDTLKSWGNPLVEETAERMGAKCKLFFRYLLTSDFARLCDIIMLVLTNLEIDTRSAGVWDAYSVTDGRLVTGQNPQSAMKTAEAVVEAFSKL